MEVNARKRGKYWEYYFEIAKIGAKRRRITKGGFKTKKEALEFGAQAKAEYDTMGVTFTASDISVQDFMYEWFEKKAKIEYKSATLRKYESIIKHHINKDLGTFKLKTLTPLQLQEYINTKYLKQGYSKPHISHLMSCLSVAFNYAIVPCNYIKQNPMVYVKIPRKQNTEICEKKVITKQEFESIIDYFDKKNLQSIKLAWYLGYYTGLRRSEVIALSWKDINFSNKTLRVKFTQSVGLGSKNIINSPKTPTSKRTILIGYTLIKELKKWRKIQKKNRLLYGEYYINNYIDKDGVINNVSGEPYDFIFTNESGKALVTTNIGASMKMIKRDLDLDIKFHDLRHTNATMLIENGASLKAVQARLGHSRLDTTFNVYLHNTKSMEKEIVNILESM